MSSYHFHTYWSENSIGGSCCCLLLCLFYNFFSLSTLPIICSLIKKLVLLTFFSYEDCCISFKSVSNPDTKKVCLLYYSNKKNQSSYSYEDQSSYGYDDFWFEKWGFFQPTLRPEKLCWFYTDFKMLWLEWKKKIMQKNFMLACSEFVL